MAPPPLPLPEGVDMEAAAAAEVDALVLLCRSRNLQESPPSVAFFRDVGLERGLFCKYSISVGLFGDWEEPRRGADLASVLPPGLECRVSTIELASLSRLFGGKCCGYFLFEIELFKEI